MIKHVRITNFKSLADVSVNLDPVTVLIGRSGTGKSNFVEALRFLRDYLTQRNDAFVHQLGGWQQIVSATANRPMSISFQVRFDTAASSEDYQYSLTFHQHPQSQPHAPPIFQEEKLLLGERTLFHQAEGKWIHQPAMVNLPPAGSLILGALTGFPEVTIAHLVLSKGLGCYTFPDTVLRSLSPGQQPSTTALLDNGDNFVQAFVGIVSNLQARRNREEMFAALRELNPSVRSVEPEMPQQQRLFVSHDPGGRLLVLDQESEGFRRFLAHLIALYQTPPKQTLIFEEPEKGIHPGALAALTDQFKACPEAERGQVILTTHSPELLDHFAPEQLRVVDIHNYLTTIGPVVEEQKEAIREQLLRPGELLTVDPARMASAVALEG